ncbi:alpha/beta hydrolase [Shewanella sp. HL-SH2]|uniref:alpha/beta hydrolase n=1 Tax=Shewanella sp. HL-SH2 TaxID=3436238 RepID=UPI003EBFD6B2
MSKHLKKIIYYGNNSQQFAHLYLPKGTTNIAVVIVIHGGYWKDNHSLETYATSAIVEYLQDFDVAILNLEYRRMNAIGANINAPWPATFKDVADGLDHLKVIGAQHSLDLERVLLIGHSAGGHLATWAASRGNIARDSELYCASPLAIKRVIAISAILNLFAANEVDQPEQINRLMGGEASTMHQRYLSCDPLSLNSKSINLTLVHGAQDTCVSINQTQQYCLYAKGKVNQVIMAEADHFSMLPHEGQWQVEQWLQIQALIAENIKALV